MPNNRTGAVIVNLPDSVPEGSTVQTYTWAPCDDSTEVLLYKVINGGHTWPGSVGTTGIGITNRDIIASYKIWKFVSRFSIDLTTGLVHSEKGMISRIYPNPSYGGEITIGFTPMNKPAELDILNAGGCKMAGTGIPPGCDRFIIESGRLKPGLYLVRIHNDNVIWISKLVVL